MKLFYCFGQAVESGYLAINGFIFFYYTAVLGMPGSLVGLAVAISMVLDAAFDPIIGSWSDSVRSKYGRRLPVMLIGAPLTFLTMGLLFSPPGGLAPLLLFAWLTLTKMGVRAFASMYNIPYFALGGELSDGYVERSQIVAIRLLAGIVITVAITALAFSVFFAGEGGLQRPEPYPAFGWSIAAVVLACALICCLGVWRYAASLPQPHARAPAMIGRLPGELAEIFHNRSFVVLFLTMLAFASAAGVTQTLNNHAYVFVWQLRPETIQLLTYTFLFGILLGVPATPLLLRWIEKKSAAIVGFLMVMTAWAVLPGLRVAGVIAPTGLDALPWLAVTNLLLGLGSGIVFIAFPAMMADAADEHEYLFGHRREGLYFSGLGFAGKAAAGVGTLVGGLALDILHFPREAGRQVHAVVSEDVLRGLVFAWAPVPMLLCLVGLAVFLPYSITRARQDVIAAALRIKRADDVSAGRSS
ncbi:MAG: MFS transporter [Phenylobacterium sp.]